LAVLTHLGIEKRDTSSIDNQPHGVYRWTWKPVIVVRQSPDETTTDGLPLPETLDIVMNDAGIRSSPRPGDHSSNRDAMLCVPLQRDDRHADDNQRSLTKDESGETTITLAILGTAPNC
jgi:hypothetical protein